MNPEKSRQILDGELTSQGEDEVADLYQDESMSIMASNDQLISRAEDQVQDPDLGKADFNTISADVYARCWESRIKLQKLDIWIAIAVYTVMCGVAFMAL